jgi:hypothetical protein
MASGIGCKSEEFGFHMGTEDQGMLATYWNADRISPRDTFHVYNAEKTKS